MGALVSIACVSALLAPLACVGRTPEPVLVSAAVSLSTALEELGAQYMRDTGAPVRFNFAGSNVLARQIVEGAAVTCSSAPTRRRCAFVEQAGLIDRRARAWCC